MAHPQRPLSTRPLDLLYFVFLLIHFPATLAIDLQPLYPPHLVPSPIRALLSFYLNTSNDPLLQGAMNGGPEWAWIRSFFFLEAVGQLPMFVLGARGLYRDSPRIYLPLLIYATSSATTTIACIATVLSLPSHASPAPGELALSTQQRAMLLASYVPFLLVPLGMAIDMAGRVGGLVCRGLAANAKGKEGKKE